MIPFLSGKSRQSSTAVVLSWGVLRRTPQTPRSLARMNRAALAVEADRWNSDAVAPHGR
jgi:hypothetical protein